MLRLLRFTVILAIAIIIAGPSSAALRRGKSKPDMARYQSAAADRDFNADSFGDLLYRNPATGSLDGALQIGSHSLTTFHIGTLTRDWELAGFADFDRDGRADILVHNTTTGDVQIWYFPGTEVKQVEVRPLPSGFHIAGVADFDGDGYRDILTRNDRENVTTVWLMNKTSVREIAVLATDSGITSHTQVGGIGDVDGDGRADIIWIDRNTANLRISFGNGSTIRETIDQGPVTAGYVLEAVADFDGDQKADLFFRNVAKGRWGVALLDGKTVKRSTELAVEEPARLSAVLDLDFDGRADLVFQPLKGPLHVYLMRGTTYLQVAMPVDFPGSDLVGTR